MSKNSLAFLEREAGFKALFNYATIGIIVVDNTGVISMVNPNAEKLFGYTSDELIGSKIESLMPQRYQKEHIEHRASYHKNPKARAMGEGIDLKAKRKDGSEFPVEISLGHYQVEDKSFAVGFINDISDRKAIETKLQNHTTNLQKKVIEKTQQLIAALQKEKQLNELKSNFVAMASHEFRTPLSAILSSATLIRKYQAQEQQDKREKHLDTIDRSVENMVEILDDFLSLDKLDKGKQKAYIKLNNIAEIVEKTIQETTCLRKKEQEVNYEHHGDVQSMVDAKLLNHVLTNLLSNAIKYSDASIDFETDANNERLRIKITDHGIGIPEADYENLFGLFFRAKNAGHIQGTGLGLNIVKKYVELMKGEVSFESELGIGTTFLVTIPQNRI
jgi:PAS domain S-box-containing protein